MANLCLGRPSSGFCLKNDNSVLLSLPVNSSNSAGVAMYASLVPLYSLHYSRFRYRYETSI